MTGNWQEDFGEHYSPESQGPSALAAWEKREIERVLGPREIRTCDPNEILWSLEDFKFLYACGISID